MIWHLGKCSSVAATYVLGHSNAAKVYRMKKKPRIHKMKGKSRRHLDKPFRSNLKAIWREFKRCSEMYRPLYHDELLFVFRGEGWRSSIPLSDAHCLWFTNANLPEKDRNEWWSWERMPMCAAIGRFSGFPDGLQEFKKLAETAAILFDEMEFDIRDRNYHAWLHLLHGLAGWHQLPLLRSKVHPPRQYDDSPPKFQTFDLEELQVLAEKWHGTPDGGPEYPIHRCTYFLVHSVFISSMALIEAILDPDSVVFTSSAIESNFDRVLGALVVPNEEQSAITPELAINVSSDKNVFKKVADKIWLVQFVEGDIEPERELVREQLGFYHIQTLLSSEKQPVSYLELDAASPKSNVRRGAAETLRVPDEDEYHDGSQGRRSGTGVFDVVDAETISDLRRRRQQLLTEIEKATSDGNQMALDRSKELLEEIEQYLGRATNRWGRSRHFALGTPEGDARNRVSKNISIALASLRNCGKLSKLTEFLKRHLQPQEAHGRQYTMAGEVKWETT